MLTFQNVTLTEIVHFLCLCENDDDDDDDDDDESQLTYLRTSPKPKGLYALAVRTAVRTATCVSALSIGYRLRHYCCHPCNLSFNSELRSYCSMWKLLVRKKFVV